MLIQLGRPRYVRKNNNNILKGLEQQRGFIVLFQRGWGSEPDLILKLLDLLR